MKIIKIKDDIFKTETLFILDCSPEEANCYLKKIGNKDFIDEHDENIDGELIKDSRYNVERIIWVRSFSRTRPSILIHEIFHLVIRICTDKGIPVSSDGDETGAYLMEFYVRKILKEL